MLEPYIVTVKLEQVPLLQLCKRAVADGVTVGPTPNIRPGSSLAKDLIMETVEVSKVCSSVKRRTQTKRDSF